MSAAPDMKQSALEGAIGPTDDLTRLLREKLAAAKDFVLHAEALLRSMGADPSELPDPNRYKGVLPEPAMMLFFNSNRGRPMAKEEIIDELISGNVRTGASSQDPTARKTSVKRSIEANIIAGKLKRVAVTGNQPSDTRELIGLADWPNEKFCI
jgi:hypothetical protein